MTTPETGPGPALFGMSLEQLQAVAREEGAPAFRGRQIADWLYRKPVDSIDAMSNLPADFRRRLG